MIELPAHLHLFPLSSATLNAISFKYVYEMESLKTLQTFPPTVWKQGSRGWQQGRRAVASLARAQPVPSPSKNCPLHKEKKVLLHLPLGCSACVDTGVSLGPKQYVSYW